MYMGKKTPKTDYYMQIKQEKLEACDEEKDLGITFHPKLDFDVHISNITKKANQMLGILNDFFSYRQIYIFEIV